jgi:putative NIF3 family GTP cyclohydrolase 1 type 2
MVELEEVVHKLNNELDIEAFGIDSAFKRFIPDVYNTLQFDWKSEFERDFSKLFNGLMLRGASSIGSIFLAVFPTDDVLDRFIGESNEGDLLFMHHPLLMECGDPRGKWGRGFVPIKEDFIRRIKAKNLSVYTCHTPLDYHNKLGTSIAIAKALNVDIVDGLLSSEAQGNLILIGTISNTNTRDLITNLKDIFDIPYVDFEGQHLNNIQKVAIVAGCGDKKEWMIEAESRGVQAYITGEIHCHIDNDYGKQKFQQIVEYASRTSMSLIGISHSASEYLVKKTLMKDWFEQNFHIRTVLLPQEKWWL